VRIRRLNLVTAANLKPNQAHAFLDGFGYLSEERVALATGCTREVLELAQ